MTDNYFNTLATISWAKHKGMHVVGTVQKNFLPGMDFGLKPSASRGTVRVLQWTGSTDAFGKIFSQDREREREIEREREKTHMVIVAGVYVVSWSD